jgi:hypothetical protein
LPYCYRQTDFGEPIGDLKSFSHLWTETMWRLSWIRSWRPERCCLHNESDEKWTEEEIDILWACSPREIAIIPNRSWMD